MLEGRVDVMGPSGEAARGVEIAAEACLGHHIIP
jgi:hypothetical protein